VHNQVFHHNVPSDRSPVTKEEFMEAQTAFVVVGLKQDGMHLNTLQANTIDCTAA